MRTIIEIETVEELESLPPTSLIREHDGFLRLKLGGGDWLLCLTNCGSNPSKLIELPAKLLYSPAVTNE